MDGLWRWPVVMLVLRAAVIAVGMALAYAGFAATGHRDALVLALTTGTAMTVLANLVSLLALVRLTRGEARRLRDLVGFSWHRFLPDLGWGVLWVLVLNTPFIVVIMALTFVVYLPTDGQEWGAAFQHVFAGPVASSPSLSFDFPIWYLGAVALAFALLNPVVEEMHYRAWLQPALTSLTGRAWMGILVMAGSFGLQHVTYGWTPTGGLIYFAAFFVWGTIAGLIYRRQRRLVPLIFTHFLVNGPFVAIPVLFTALN